MTFKQYPILAIALGLSLAGSAAMAASITGLVNTGAGLSADQQDTNYAFAVVAGSATSAGFGYVASDAGYPFPNWLADSSTSHWLTPTTNQGQSYDVGSASGTYTWTLSFDLTGYDASTASFGGRWASDNNSSVYLNGTLLASTPNTEASFAGWTDMGTVSSGFVSGVNTLQFIVTNVAKPPLNPTGLRVEFSGSTVSAVPEPQSYALLLAGLTGVGYVARRRRTS